MSILEEQNDFYFVTAPLAFITKQPWPVHIIVHRHVIHQVGPKLFASFAKGMIERFCLLSLAGHNIPIQERRDHPNSSFIQNLLKAAKDLLPVFM